MTVHGILSLAKAFAMLSFGTSWAFSRLITAARVGFFSGSGHPSVEWYELPDVFKQRRNHTLRGSQYVLCSCHVRGTPKNVRTRPYQRSAVRQCGLGGVIRALLLFDFGPLQKV